MAMRSAQEALAEAEVVLFGVGAQKAGTTWLFEQLARCPEVHLARPKELHYWDTIRPPFSEKYRTRAQLRLRADREAGVLGRIAQTFGGGEGKRRPHLERYAALLTGDPYDHAPYAEYLVADRGAARIVGDITPRYARLNARTFEEMAGLHGRVRFVFALRDPVDRLWSAVRHRARSAMKRGVVAGAALDRAFTDALEDPLHPDRILSDYPATMTRLEGVVGAGAVQYLFFETMFEPGGLAPLARHLGLDTIPQEAEERVNAGVETAHRLSPELRAAARRALSPVYDALFARFGEAVPARWRRDAAESAA